MLAISDKLTFFLQLGFVLVWLTRASILSLTKHSSAHWGKVWVIYVWASTVGLCLNDGGSLCIFYFIFLLFFCFVLFWNWGQNWMELWLQQWLSESSAQVRIVYIHGWDLPFWTKHIFIPVLSSVYFIHLGSWLAANVPLLDKYHEKQSTLDVI